MYQQVLPTLFTIGLTLAHGTSAAEDKVGLDEGSRQRINIRFLRKLENPRPDGRGGNNSYLLKGMPKDAPNVAATFAAGHQARLSIGSMQRV